MSKRFLIIFAVVASSGLVNPQTRIHRKFREFIFDITGRSINEPRLFKLAENNNKIQNHVPDSVEFPCSDDEGHNLFRSKIKPTTIHKLRPGDFDLIGALGDSLTAGNGAGASDILQVLSENRGVSWSIGGKSNWREFVTLPNILKEFNPKLIGYATGDALSHQKSSQFNVAELGAMSMDLPFMVRELVKRIKRDPRVDLKNDWKLVTVMMGANDFCYNICYFQDPLKTVEIHRKELNYTLTYMMKNLPRTLVNMVPAPDVNFIKTYNNLSPSCKLYHKLLCPCFTNEAYRPLFKTFRKVVKNWQKVQRELAEAEEFSKDDFAVVYQPFDLNPNFQDSAGNTDYSLLSTDCFHFSQKGHGIAGNALWNNMMEPVGKKSTTWNNLFEKFLCPTPENPYVSTSKNSQYSNYQIPENI